MPLESTFSSKDKYWGLWKIAEDEETLQAEVPHEIVSPTLSNSLKRLEFLAGRALLKALLQHWNLNFHRIEKDEFGKPYLSGFQVHISLSHSYPYVAAIIHRNKNVGIDLEQPKDKLLRIAPRILSQVELADAGDNIIKHCVYWCAKETLIKIYGRKDLVFSQNLAISPFTLQSSGQLVGRIVANQTETAILLEYIVSDYFVVVVSD